MTGDLICLVASALVKPMGTMQHRRQPLASRQARFEKCPVTGILALIGDGFTYKKALGVNKAKG
ncbi:MAG: hypothetical protein Q7R66_16510 [Undibacterium sp.]|uniref:hypothetical protein n=1 Tax=Undibacterium sp. TaxID=1914977 RepID=UPI0027180913|nr:hypothetical protein [Undibacterium sp.]MDO8653783.1 hypothetical protein [Undibacterium sp.]